MGMDRMENVSLFEATKGLPYAASAAQGVGTGISLSFAACMLTKPCSLHHAFNMSENVSALRPSALLTPLFFVNDFGFSFFIRKEL